MTWCGSFTKHIITGGKLYIKSYYTLGPQRTWHIKVKAYLITFNSIDVISVKRFHKETINDKI